MEALLLATTVTTGLVAGLFYAYSISVLPALRPLNNALDAAGSANPAGARAGFESRWTRWNHVRTWLSTASLASYCFSLLQA